ncbi:MAG: GHMP kinase [Methylophilaceae bacterium]|nr:GHMP kinase [Methylophilaceae bacterium]
MVEKLMIKSVHVTANARLHMGFFDLNGGLGRRFGSIGLGLDAPVTEINVHHLLDANILKNEVNFNERTFKIIKNYTEVLNIKNKFNVECLHLIPEHAGLGSGTQLALAIGSAINQLSGLNLTLQQLAAISQRGARSGIGVGTFKSGGIVVDGGRGELTEVPPIIARADFPEDWRVLLIFDEAHIGKHGEQEVTAFRTLSEASLASAEKLSHRILMQALPALAEQDLTSFGHAIRELQICTGDYFAPVQGGRYASKSVEQVLNFLELQAVPCFGQSSWGPTGFAIFANVEEANKYQNLLNMQFKHLPTLSYQVSKGLNQGASISQHHQ